MEIIPPPSENGCIVDGFRNPPGTPRGTGDLPGVDRVVRVVVPERKRTGTSQGKVVLSRPGNEVPRVRFVCDLSKRRLRHLYAPFRRTYQCRTEDGDWVLPQGTVRTHRDVGTDSDPGSVLGYSVGTPESF